MDLVGWVFALTLVSMLVVIRKPVQIIDYSNVSQVYQVDNVPIGLAIPRVTHHACRERPDTGL
ncbi:conjugal transfer mating pair stabilization protein TraG [Raoultella ornithinolytica]|nr:conjugal transfer mating pair stabilization protein TraG [Raoultella ornithinolytica]